MALPAVTASLDAFHAEIAPRFHRSKVQARARRYRDGLLAPLARKNGWPRAEVLGERTPDGVQRLFNAARWDADGVRGDLHPYVVTHLGDAEAVLGVDKTGCLKKGTQSAGRADRELPCHPGDTRGSSSSMPHRADRRFSTVPATCRKRGRRTRSGVRRRGLGRLPSVCGRTPAWR